MKIVVDLFAGGAYVLVVIWSLHGVLVSINKRGADSLGLYMQSVFDLVMWLAIVVILGWRVFL